MAKFHSILSALIVACFVLVSAAQEPEATQSSEAEPQNQLRRRELQSAQEALNTNKAKWNSFNINEYVYHVKTQDFFYDVSFACRVTNNVIGSLQSTLEVTQNSTLNLPNLSPPTVSGLFDKIQQAIRSSRNPGIQVFYEATYGYPKVINLDYGQAAPGFFFLTDSIRATVEAMIPVSVESTRIQTASTKWNRAWQWNSWDATYQQGQNYLVQVRSGSITSVRDERNRDVTGDFVGNANIRNRLLIQDSFREVRSILNTKKPKTFSVTYNPTYGYITSLSATYASYTNDGANVAYSILSLQSVGTALPVPPTGLPSVEPSSAPPTRAPTRRPSPIPTRSPTPRPSVAPSMQPTTKPPTKSPTKRPSPSPTKRPSPSPTKSPTKSPTTPVPTSEVCVPRFETCIAGESRCCNPNDQCGASSVCRPSLTNAKQEREKLSRERAFTGIPSRNGGRRGLQMRGM